MLTIANLDGKDKVRYIISLPSAFLRYLGEMFFAYLAPVIGATGDWPKVVLVQLGILKSATVMTKDGNFNLTEGNMREFVMRIKGSHTISSNIKEGLEKYDRLKTEGRTVVDLGAHKGDTAVYFALHKRAKRIITFEPQESLCRIADRTSAD